MRPRIRSCCRALLIGYLYWLASHRLVAQSPRELAAEAGRALQNKDYAKAEQVYSRVLTLVPEVAEMYSNYGLACYYQRKLACAERAFSRALELKRNLFLPNWLLGQLLFDRGDYKEALPLVERAFEQGQARREVANLLAGTLIGLGRHSRAIALYESVVQSDSSDPDAHYRLGKTYLDLGQNVMARLRTYPHLDFGQLLAAERFTPHEDALEGGHEPMVAAQTTLAVNAYKDAIASGIEVRGARVEYAKLEIDQGNTTAAKEALDGEIRLDPWSYEARFQLARVAALEGDLLGAARMLDAAVAIRPEFFDPMPPLGLSLQASAVAASMAGLLRDAIDGQFGAAMVLGSYFAPRDRQEASRWATAAIEARHRALAETGEGSGTDARQAAAHAVNLLRRKRYELGIETLLAMPTLPALPQGGDLELARALYRTARYDDVVRLFRAHDPTAPELIYLVGSSLAKLGLGALQAMVRVDPDSARAHQILGEALFAQERYIESASAFEEAIGRKPDDSELRFLLGTAQYKQMAFPAAAEAFRQSIALDARNAEAHMMLGDALLQTDDSEGAVAALTKALELEDALTQAHALLGKAYRAQGKLEMALASLERGAAADEDGSVHYQLFMLYQRTRQPAKAKGALEISERLRQAARRAARPGLAQ